MVTFDWDKSKAKSNLKKHKISFEEAASVFSSTPIRVFLDQEHSTNKEDRFVAIGYSQIHRLLVVIHCYFEDKEVIRIISARKATKQERTFFEEG